MNVKCTIVKPTVVEIEFHCSNLCDDDYIAQKREEAKTKAANIMECDPEDLIIHDSDIPALIE